MRISKVHDITLDFEEKIQAAALKSTNELILLMNSGDVIRYSIEEEKTALLFTAKTGFSHEDGGFDINAESTIYTLDSIVVVVNDYKQHGFVHYPNYYEKLHIQRRDYYADISCYPIALYKNEAGVPHLIYAQDWNHIQIMNLNTRQILTAAKSLIEENAEEKRIEFYKKHKEFNKLPWPSPYDYFFGKLSVSPDKKYFLSTGWAWGSCDFYKVYELKHFIENNRIAQIDIGSWEHSNRAACWIGDRTVAVAYDPLEEGDDGATEHSAQELHFYTIKDNQSVLERKIEVPDIDLVNAEIYFNKEAGCFILLSEKDGIVVLSTNVEMLLKDRKRNFDSYNTELNLLLEIKGNNINICQIERE